MLDGVICEAGQPAYWTAYYATVNDLIVNFINCFSREYIRPYIHRSSVGHKRATKGKPI